MLVKHIDCLVGAYTAGFLHSTVNPILASLWTNSLGQKGNTYIFHDFKHRRVLGLGGLPSFVNESRRLLHDHSFTLDGGQHNLPLPDVFDWHYMQCVIKRFGTPDYHALPNIEFYELPFKTEDDDDDQIYEHDDEGTPPYPSYHFDHFISQTAERLALAERRDAVEQWRADANLGACNVQES
jgi:hypothetical protein